MRIKEVKKQMVPVSAVPIERKCLTRPARSFSRVSHDLRFVQELFVWSEDEKRYDRKKLSDDIRKYVWVMQQQWNNKLTRTWMLKAHENPFPLTEQF